MNVIAFIRALPVNEPVLLGGLVSSVLTTGTAFGLHLTGGQVAAVASTTIVVASFVIRQFVIPPAGASGALKGPTS